MKSQNSDSQHNDPFEHFLGSTANGLKVKSQTSWKTGWRFSVARGALAAFIVFAINLGALLWAKIRLQETTDASARLYEGSCSKVRSLNTGIHLVINVLSTILLSCSNFTMQCVSAPTREDVDHAHARYKWLDIGIHSPRNFIYIQRSRAFLWILLAISSLPLHFFYNSAVFSSLSANDYWVAQVPQNFLDPGYTFNASATTYTTDSGATVTYYSVVRPNAANVIPPLLEKLHAGDLINLTNSECINTYGTDYMSDFGNLLIVLDDLDTSEIHYLTVANEWIFPPGEACDQYAWMCPPGTCSCRPILPYLLQDPSNWAPYGYKVAYCLAESVPEHCQLQFSIILLLIVTAMNLLKCGVMIFAALGIHASPLMTTGDATASFLERPDAQTENMCLNSKEEFMKNDHQGWPTEPKKYSDIRQRWSTTVGKHLWIYFAVCYILAIALCLFFLFWGIKTLPSGKNISSLWSLGFGAMHHETMISWQLPSQGAPAIVLNALIANIPQFLLSLIYIFTNAIMTYMLLSSEWSAFANQAAGLRVSNKAIGSQRPSYFLSLPYLYALPLIAASALLHWLVSQSIFLISIDGYKWQDNDTRTLDGADTFMTCGYSPMAIIFTIVAGVVMIVVVSLLSCRRFSSGMPLASNCSTAIAAACHPPIAHDGVVLAENKVKWGEVDMGEKNVKHCAFALEKNVVQPTVGEFYAGNGKVISGVLRMK